MTAINSLLKELRIRVCSSMDGNGTSVFPNSDPEISLNVVPEALLAIESIIASKTHISQWFIALSISATDLNPWFVAMGLAAIPR